MDVFSCTVFVLSGRDLCDGLIPRPEESYRLWRVSECDQVKIKTLYTYCEQVGRGGKGYERTFLHASLSVALYGTASLEENAVKESGQPLPASTPIS
jgi:hypothetical protein